MSETWKHTLERKRLRSRDGTDLSYETLGHGPRTLLLCNGLGGRLYAWGPLLDRFADRFRLITWDYRGLFDSGTPPTRRKLSIAHHSDDALAILDAEGVERAGLVGWSMGVQVGLDVAATHPDRVEDLVLINGTYGHALSTGFQPLFSLPWLPKKVHWGIEQVHGRDRLRRAIAAGARVGAPFYQMLFVLTAGARAFELRPLLDRYMEDVLGPSFDNYLRLFQELDAHSVYHVLPEISAPALVISGALDLLTPQRQSFEIARRLPNAKHVPLARASHFALLERPDAVLPAMERFYTANAQA
ncbi:MAG: alpha/beta fold hydrolase [Sandaracinus sp.]|nr:alpha/beta fold hydrolase [Sandaracinus sp.]MCB9636685.1 alpha/beta fold hydrolase [Sandaracinus sp.]